MGEGDRERWNARYAEEAETPAPSPFLLSLDDVLPRRGRALDVAGGSGRNALWLARRGLDVTLADVSDVALARAARAARDAG
ncbi:MAG TPA: methyltransferase domain-containing protein, partial [Anaeromyxobacter sp.]